MADFSVLNYWRSYRHFKVVAVILVIIGLAFTSEGESNQLNCACLLVWYGWEESMIGILVKTFSLGCIVKMAAFFKL